MGKKIAFVAPWLAAAAVGGALALAPLASANTNPGVPYGGNNGNGSSASRVDPSQFGQHEQNQDETDGTAGSFDVPF